MYAFILAIPPGLRTEGAESAQLSVFPWKGFHWCFISCLLRVRFHGCADCNPSRSLKEPEGTSPALYLWLLPTRKPSLCLRVFVLEGVCPHIQDPKFGGCLWRDGPSSPLGLIASRATHSRMPGDHGEQQKQPVFKWVSRTSHRPSVWINIFPKKTHNRSMRRAPCHWT